MNCTPRKSVALIGLPPGFLDNLPQDDRQALLDAVGKKVRFNGYDEHGRAELEFRDGVWHFIYLDPKLNWYTGTD
jgi:hypothetical protein